MKKTFIILAMVLLSCTAVFSQEMSEQKAEETAPLEFPVLNTDFLVHSSVFFANITAFQTPQGEKVAYKKVNEMLRSVAENEKLIREYTAWHTAGIIFGSLLCAGVATTIVYTLADLPYQKEILVTSITASSLSFLGCMLSNYYSTSKYLQAVDNYNLSLANSSKE